MSEKTIEVRRRPPIFFLCIVLGIFIATILKTFAFDFFRVEGFSMSPEIQDGQIIFANKLAYGLVNPFTAELLFAWKKPQEGDIILYLYENAWVVKRCVAIGDTPLEYFIDSEYNLIVGNRKIALSSIQYHRMRASKKIPQGYVLAIGDNYAVSYDSRNYGFVPEKNIIGKVTVLPVLRAKHRGEKDE